MREKGFTLVELLIVVAIIGILASIAIPRYSIFLMRAKRTDAFLTLNGIYKSQLAYYVDADGFVTDGANPQRVHDKLGLGPLMTKMGYEVVPGGYVIAPPPVNEKGFTVNIWVNLDNRDQGGMFSDKDTILIMHNYPPYTKAENGLSHIWYDDITNVTNHPM